MSDNKILFLLYNYPPEFGTAPKRNFQMSEGIRRNFSDYYIITRRKEGGIANDNLTGLTSFDYRAILRVFNKSGYVAESVKKSLWSQFFIKFINTFPFNIIFGEGGGIYLFRSVQIASGLIRKQGYTHVYSSYRPVADHVAACILKWKFPQLIWIADFRDLPVEPHYKQQFFPGLHHFIYSRLFRKSRVLTTVSEGLAIELKRYHNDVCTVMNGLNPGFTFPKSRQTTFFNIVYTGSMFLDERNPLPLIRAIKKLAESSRIDINRLRIHYAGKDGWYWEELAGKNNLTPILVNHHLLSAAEANALQQDACINVLLTMASEQLQGVMTGKYIEYIQAGSPILAIVKNQNDPFLERELNELKAGISVSDKEGDLKKIEQFILDKYMNWSVSGRNEKSSEQVKVLEKYNADRLVSVLKKYYQD